MADNPINMVADGLERIRTGLQLAGFTGVFEIHMPVGDYHGLFSLPSTLEIIQQTGTAGRRTTAAINGIEFRPSPHVHKKPDGMQ